MTTATRGSTPDERALEQQAKLVAQTFMLFGKAIKNIGIYLHNTARHVEFLEPVVASIRAYGEAYGPMVVTVDSGGFTFAKKVVFDESFQNDSISYKFYREGVRRLVFRPEIEMEEFQTFTRICMANFSSGEHYGKDALSLLWEAELQNIEYAVVDSFSIDGVDDEEVEVEVDKVVSYLYSRLKSNSGDYLRFARLQAEDLETQLEGVDAIRGGIIQGTPASEELKAELKEEIRQDIEERMLPKLVNTIFQVVQEMDGQDQSVQEVLIQLLDAMLLQEDFASINHIVTKLKALERDPVKGAFYAMLRQNFVSRMGEEERIRKIGEILNTSRPEDSKAIFRYLFNLDSNAVVPLLEVLERIEIQENRQVICDALVAIGAETPDPFVHRLDSDKSQLVRDMIYVIDRIDFPDKTKMFKRVLSNPNLAVRLEALQIIARSKTEECRQLVVECLSDPNAQMRIQAARALPQYDKQLAYVELSRLVRDSDFQKRDFKEKFQIYQALGSTQQQGALAYFNSLLQQKGLFGKKKQQEDKLLAIGGLSQFASIPSFKLLKAVSEDTSNPAEIRQAAHRGMLHVRKELFGEEA